MDHTPHGDGIADETSDLWHCVRDLLMRPDGTASSTVVGLPSRENPRSLVVIEDRRAAARLVRRQFGGGGISRSLQAEAIAALIAIGVAARIPALSSAVPAARPGLGYREWLLQALPAEARVAAILLGPPRANRKPVVLVTNGDGDLIAVAKFGVNAVTCPLVRHEAVALREVSDALGGIVHVPSLLASGAVGGGEAVLMGPLPPRASGQRPDRTALIKVVRAVGAIDRRAGEKLWDLASHPRLAPLRTQIGEVSRRNEGVELGSFHGDLHPGNLAMAQDKRVILWDWERWGHGAPVGFDLLHHDMHSWITQDGMAPRDAASTLICRASEILEPLRIEPSRAPAIAREYLIRLAARYADDDQDRAGSRLGRIEQWLFPAVLGEHQGEDS